MRTIGIGARLWRGFSCSKRTIAVTRISRNLQGFEPYIKQSPDPC